MKDESADPGGPAAGATSAPSLPAAVDRATFQAELDRLRAREKAHTREGDAIAAARRPVISEPEPAPAARELFPDDLATKPRFLCFLFFVLQAG